MQNFVIGEIDDEQWEYRENFYLPEFLKKLKDLSIEKDGIGIKLPFNITLFSSGSTVDYRSVLISSKKQVDKGIFHSLCPELESYVTLINWMPEDNDTNYFKFQDFTKCKDLSQNYKIQGKYRICKDSFFSILPYYCNIVNSVVDMKHSWITAPYLKRSGELFGVYPSPLFMSKLHSQRKNVSEERINYFTAPFKILNIKNDKASILFLNTTSRSKTNSGYDILIDKIIASKIKCGNIYIGLFQESIYKSEGYQREFILKDIGVENSTKEIVGHFILQWLYHNYLKKVNGDEINLYLCTYDDLLRYIERTLKKVNLILENNNKLDDNFYLEYLGNFEHHIKIIEKEYIYYCPFLLSHLSKKEFKDFILTINNFSDIHPYELMPHEKMKFFDDKRNIKILNLYNSYSKRVMIKLLNSKDSYYTTPIKHSKEYGKFRKYGK